MIEGLTPYREYADSGLLPIGAIPSHWQTLRAKHLFREVDERSVTGKETLLSVSHISGVRRRSELNANMFLAKSNAGHKLCQPNDLVINTMWAWMGALGVSPHAGIVSPAYGVYRPQQNGPLLPAFVDHILRTPAYVAEYTMRSSGIHSSRLRLYPESFLRIPLIVPPPNEQAAIVRFLNHANRRIDRFIRAKRKLIALLNEQKQAIIHRAVTRGLDPASSCYETGNRWFPQLPGGWEILTLRRVISGAIDGPHFSPNYVDTGVPFLSARNIKTDRWSLDDAKFITEADYREFSRRVKPEVGDVLYTKGGTTGVARAVDLTFPFQVWVHIAVLKVIRERMEPSYLAYCLNSARCYEQSQLFTRGATNQDLGLGRMKQIELPVPPDTRVQQAIVARLDAQLAEHTRAASKAEREISLIREYRTRLVADVVTGQLDVREAAARLPDDQPEAAVEELASEADQEEDTESEEICE